MTFYEFGNKCTAFKRFPCITFFFISFNSFFEQSISYKSEIFIYISILLL